MTGREERDQILHKSLENKLNDKPKYIKNWYYYLLSQNTTENTCNDYVNKIISFLLSINGDVCSIHLEDITLQDVINYLADKTSVNGKKYSDSYKQCIWSALNNFFEFCVKNKYMKYNFMVDIKRSANKDLKRINENRIRVTKDDYVKIIENIHNGVGTSKAKRIQNQLKNRDILIILLFMTTGMRKSALCQINIEDIDIKNRHLVVIDKGYSVLNYYIGDTVINYLRMWLKDRDLYVSDSNALFITRDGKRISNSAIDKLIDKYCTPVIGKHMSAHKFRSGFCSINYDETNDIEFVRRAVGHSNISTTQRYIRTNNDETRKASNIMNSIFSN